MNRKINNSTAMIKQWKENRGKDIALQEIKFKLLFQAVVRETTEQPGVSRQVRGRRQKRERYISRPGRLLDVVCCHLLVCMFVQFQHYTIPIILIYFNTRSLPIKTQTNYNFFWICSKYLVYSKEKSQIMFFSNNFLVLEKNL